MSIHIGVASHNGWWRNTRSIFVLPFFCFVYGMRGLVVARDNRALVHLINRVADSIQGLPSLVNFFVPECGAFYALDPLRYVKVTKWT